MKNTVKFLGVIALIAITGFTMVACASLTIVSVDWDSLKGPSKTRQYLGVSSQEVTVFAHYKDESRKEVTFFTVTHDRDRTGTQTVTVNVLGQGTGTFQTEVMEMTGIRIERQPSKTSYEVGERADLAGIKVMGSWRDLPDAEVPAYQVTVSSFDSSSAGNRAVTVDYKGKRATFNVAVVVPATPAPAAPAAQQSTQTAQQPSQGQLDQRLVGTWRSSAGSVGWIFNADGTAVSINTASGNEDYRWRTSGNTLTTTRLNPDVDYVYTYSISGNTLTFSREVWAGYTYTFTGTRQ